MLDVETQRVLCGLVIMYLLFLGMAVTVFCAFWRDSDDDL